jgi:hypothetical protein
VTKNHFSNAVDKFTGRALVTIEAGVDPALAAAVIERLAQ